MSSFVNDNVSESKKQEQQITENQENSEETTTETKTSSTTTTITTTEKNNQSEKATISNNDNKVNHKSNETNDENTKTIILENKSEKTSEDRKLTKTTTSTTTTNICDNNDVVVATDDKDKQKDKHDDVATAIDNSQNLNKLTDINNLTTAQINTSPAAAAVSLSSVLSAATCCLSNMPAGDAEQQQQQQVATIDNKQTSATSNTHSNTLPTPIIKEFSNEEANLKQQLPTEVESVTAAETATVTSPLPPLPPGLNQMPIAGSHLPHICSEPTFGVQLRNRNTEDQQQNKSTSSTKAGGSARDWRPNTSALNYSSVIKSGTVSASASPNMVRKTSDSSVLLPRRVSFPKSDNELVTGYLEPANPWEHFIVVKVSYSL
ncbi:hypothetical protein CVS40_9252 [Lucilia cuprina]|nr:hypothetical protein CVS40_9252 [Lucilia cuprina]